MYVGQCEFDKLNAVKVFVDLFFVSEGGIATSMWAFIKGVSIQVNLVSHLRINSGRGLNSAGTI